LKQVVVVILFVVDLEQFFVVDLEQFLLFYLLFGFWPGFYRILYSCCCFGPKYCFKVFYEAYVVVIFHKVLLLEVVIVLHEGYLVGVVVVVVLEHGFV
jgi:hypothetical protein